MSMNYTSTALGITVEGSASLASLSMKQLTALYNEVTGKSIKGFNKHPIAVDRVAEALLKHESATSSTPATGEPAASKVERREAIAAAARKAKPAKASKTPKVKKERAPRAGRAWKDLPAKAEQRPARAGSKVEIVCKLLGQSGGVSKEEMVKKSGVTGHALTGILRWLSRGMGWGIHRMEDGNFRFVNKDGNVISYKPVEKTE